MDEQKQTTILNNMRARLGLFLEAVGKALAAPSPALGELGTTTHGVFDCREMAYTETRLRLDLRGMAPLKDVVCQMPDGTTITFNHLVIEGLSIDARVMPVFCDDVFKLFDVSKTEQIASTPQACKCSIDVLMANGCQCANS